MCKLMTMAEKSKRDPTRTKTLRDEFEADVSRRFRDLSKRAEAYVKSERFEFTRDKDKIPQFRKWLREQNAEVLEIGAGNLSSEVDWANKYINRAYGAGVNSSASKLRKAGALVEPSFVGGAFNRPIHADRLGIIYTRTYTELEGISAAVDTQLSRILADGVGTLAPAAIARQVTAAITGIGTKRAKMLVRTEVINAHAEATLNAYTEAGLEGVEVEPEWLTAVGACDLCLQLQSRGPYTIQEARGLIPVHPNCKCSWAPTVKNGTGITLR